MLALLKHPCRSGAALLVLCKLVFSPPVTTPTHLPTHPPVLSPRSMDACSNYVSEELCTKSVTCAWHRDTNPLNRQGGWCQTIADTCWVGGGWVWGGGGGGLDA